MAQGQLVRRRLVGWRFIDRRCIGWRRIGFRRRCTTTQRRTHQRLHPIKNPRHHIPRRWSMVVYVSFGDSTSKPLASSR
jgi:hypothetical protein